MPEYNTPGVYVEEVPSGVRSIAGIATAVPVFVGQTARARGRRGEDLTGQAVEVTSLRDYEAQFGAAPLHPMTLSVEKRVDARNRILDVKVDWLRPRKVPRQFMNYALQLFFRNGGTRCYVWSLGRYGNVDAEDFKVALRRLEKVAGPTLVVMPDAVKLDDAGYATVLEAALASSARKGDRFALGDVRHAVPGGNDGPASIAANFRAHLASNSRRRSFGAAYFPYLESRLPLCTSDSSVTLGRFDVIAVARDGRERRRNRPAAAGRRLNDRRLALARREPEVYEAIRRFLKRAYATLPPSGAVAGLYARSDANLGVWKAPAGEVVKGVARPALVVDDIMQQVLAVDPTAGKSINPIRSFPRRGTLVWGARTLAGNDNEWRYVSVRRLAIFLEQSIDRGTQWAVFEPNDANTWAKLRGAVENFLTLQWRAGALQGAKPEDAFYVAVGLGQTMTADDILNGRLIVEVGFAPLRPAEFVILRLTHKMVSA